MADQDMPQAEQPRTTGSADTADETLVALMHDLTELRDYLTARGRHTYELAQRFLENARRNSDSRAYDERQATMLEYQHYIWHEIAGLVNKIVVTYGGDDEPPADDVATRGTAGEEN